MRFGSCHNTASGGWRILSDIPACARAVGAEWIHVQYQTAAYRMHPAINALPYFLRRHGLRAAWTYHDLRVPYLFPKAGARLRHWVTRLPLRAADAVVVTNQSDWDSVREQRRPGQLHRIPIGSDIESRQFSMTEQTRRRAARGYGSEQLVLGYFGFLNASKGGLTLIETVAALAGDGWDVHLLMIGERVGASDETNFSYLQRVEAAISEHGLDGRVQWTGHQSDAEVAADFNAIDVLVMPYEDGMSLRRRHVDGRPRQRLRDRNHPSADADAGSGRGLRPAARSAQRPGGDRRGGEADRRGAALGGESARQCPQGRPPVQLGCDRCAASGNV